MQIFTSMRADLVSPSIVTYNALLHAFARAQRWRTSIDLLNIIEPPEISVTPKSVKNPSLDREPRRLDFLSEDQLGSIREVLGRGIKPDEISYSTVLVACSRANNSRAALSIFYRIQRAKIKPNTNSYNAALGASRALGLWRKALSLFRSMKTNKIERDSISYIRLSVIFEVKRKWEFALDVLDDMITESASARISKPDSASAVRVFNSVIGACMKAKQKECAKKIFGMMIKSDLVPDERTQRKLQRFRLDKV
mmetsp:Transcript_1869/g.2619  ORF Transcript_1869/g.2619 Transcript_1869/m.2619 type:complete len:253 (-) Transcript_1869:91-849(-)|eukprot:CAMPEP_0167740048 /NCGR_PEP_ID=MMETSP0110_2-20121227/59_1 /TAXON_ID=629695 /ORGANISM="Gymnochlora sp., Strain CCMP2014" /LENGTH=252 /DNA_ID=CAMNT_0007623895 /DNA_START=995 /DNA_END=1753 /DNA_ORIENTATION=+